MSDLLTELKALLDRHRAWLFFDCKGAVLWVDGAPVGRFDPVAADDFRLVLTADLYGCDEDEPDA